MWGSVGSWGRFRGNSLAVGIMASHAFCCHAFCMGSTWATPTVAPHRAPSHRSRCRVAQLRYYAIQGHSVYNCEYVKSIISATVGCKNHDGVLDALLLQGKHLKFKTAPNASMIRSHVASSTLWNRVHAPVILSKELDTSNTRRNDRDSEKDRCALHPQMTFFRFLEGPSGHPFHP